VKELATIAHDSYLLSEGRVVASGPPKELLASKQETVHQFMNGEADGPVPFHYPAPDLRTQLLSGQGK
jgi:phospholipid/cholesterol/gamma-HCH transport system ATP-binding protein